MTFNDAELIESRPLRERSRQGMARNLLHAYGGGGDGGAAAAEAKRQANLDEGMTSIGNIFSKYDSNFYANRGKAYTAAVMPQVTKQYQDTKSNLTYALARNGLLNSSAATTRGQDLETEYNKNLTTVANQAQGQSNALRQQVSDTRGNLTNQLISSGDPSVALSQGNAMTAGLNTAPNFSPMGNMFSDWSNTYLSNMNARAYNPSVPSLASQLTQFA